MPIYAGSFRNYRECGTFWYMTHLVVRGGPGSQFFSLESHPTKEAVGHMGRAKRNCVFEHAQNAQIQSTHAQSDPGIDTFYSVQ